MSSPSSHPITARAFGRVGLLGNPSDGYGGKTISLIVPNFAAEVTLRPSEKLEIAVADEPLAEARSLEDVRRLVRAHGYYGGERLVLAAIKRFLDYCETAGLKRGQTLSGEAPPKGRTPFQTEKLDLTPFSVRFEVRSSIPRLVGLAGSSAIVTATVRALAKYHSVEIPPHLLASLVLSAEKDELGIPAGLQDRVVQAYEGLVAMDFSPAVMQTECGLSYGRYEQLPSSHLPPIYLAYSLAGSEPTEVTHNNLRQRYDRGEPEVLAAMQEWASLAESGKAAIAARDWERLDQLMNRNFDLRRAVCPLNPRHVAMVEAARSAGCSAKFSGSGGAIVGTYRTPDDLAALRSALEPLACVVVDVER
ncbi:MAG: mevalonate kinase [Planctomycetota bacterium]